MGGKNPSRVRPSFAGSEGLQRVRVLPPGRDVSRLMSNFNAKKGAALRDEAIDAVEEATPEQWKAHAIDAVLEVAKLRPEFTTDPVWFVLGKTLRNPAPPEPRAMGAIMRKAVSLGYCETTDRSHPSVRASCHKRPVRIWKSLVHKPKP